MAPSAVAMRARSEIYARIAQWLTVFGVGVVLASIAAYALILGQAWPGISLSSAAWGSFGDFVNGIAGTLISLATLFALALTLHLQSRELYETREELRKQATASERPDLRSNLLPSSRNG